METNGEERFQEILDRVEELEGMVESKYHLWLLTELRIDLKRKLRKDKRENQKKQVIDMIYP